jgi:hypothetical protein
MQKEPFDSSQPSGIPHNDDWLWCGGCDLNELCFFHLRKEWQHDYEGTKSVNRVTEARRNIVKKKEKKKRKLAGLNESCQFSLSLSLSFSFVETVMMWHCFCFVRVRKADEKKTKLHEAAERGESKELQWLLDTGAYVVNEGDEDKVCEERERERERGADFLFLPSHLHTVDCV